MKPISEKEPIVRFVDESNKIRPSTGSVKPKAFMPRPDNLTTSVFRTVGLSSGEVAELGQLEVAGPRRKTLLGWGLLVVSQVCEAGLEVHPEPSNHDRHANIVGWPSLKSAQKLAALKLAELAELVRA